MTRIPSPSPRGRSHPLAGMAACCAALAAATLLGGCSDGGAQRATAAPSHAAATPPFAAIARGKVEVQGGLLDVMAPTDGVVESVAVREGDSVRQGQELLRLNAGPLRHELGLAQAELRLAQARQAGQTARLPAARQTAQRLAEAARAGAIDQQRADEALVVQQDIEIAQRVAEAEAAVARQRVVLVQQRIDRQLLRAPQDGSVLRLQVQAGSQVALQGGHPLLVLLPRRPIQVRAELNESFVQSVKPGMKAQVTVDGGGAAPGAPIAARVVRIGQVVGPSRLGEEATVRTDLRVVDCFLEFDQAPSLRVGQEVRVSFHD